MAFVSSPSNINEVNTVYGVSTANTQVSPASTQVSIASTQVSTANTQVSPASTQVSTASTQVSTANLSDATVYAFLVNQPNGSQLVHEDLEQIHEDDLEERDLKWQLSLLSIRTRNWDTLQGNAEDLGTKIAGTKIKTALEELVIFTPNLDLSYSGLEEFQQLEFEGYRPKTSKSVSEDISNEVRDSHDALLVEELVSDDKLEKKTIFPTVMKIEFVRPKQQEKPVRKLVKYAKMYRLTAITIKGKGWKMVPKAFLMKTGLRPLNTVRPVNTAYPKTIVYSARPMSRFSKLEQSTTLRKLIEDMLPLGEEPKEGKLLVKELLKLMCDKKNSVLFTDTGCFVLSPDFKLADKCQVLLKVPRKNNMHNIDMKNIIPKESLTYLVAKATLDESMLWHRRLGHVNFKTINKLVKENLVRGLPTKHFENDQTCVACLKGKQHKASCKSKIQNSITQPLFMLHMDLFGLTFMSILMNKKYCLVVTDDYCIFTWVFFLPTKYETSGILKSFITEVENLVDKKVKIIRCDNGTEFKNRQNGVAERRNRTLIEAARTMLADSKLPTTFWAEAVNYCIAIVTEIGCSTNSIDFVGTEESIGVSHSSKGHGSSQDYILMPLWKDGSLLDSSSKNASNNGPQPSSDAGKKNDEGCIMRQLLLPISVFFLSETRIHKDHSLDHVIGDVQSGVQTRRMTKTTNEQGFISTVYEGKTYEDLHTCLFACFLSQVEPKKKVWTLVDLLYGKRSIRTKWVYRNKKDKRSIVVRNKVRLVAQGYTQEMGIDYDEVFAPVARIEAIRLFLAYASFKNFVVYQMDMKSTFC
ncbi:putative ribonuclease H-like domain-containing protein [Tanacetum coccineum]